MTENLENVLENTLIFSAVKTDKFEEDAICASCEKRKHFGLAPYIKKEKTFENQKRKNDCKTLIAQDKEKMSFLGTVE